MQTEPKENRLRSLLIIGLTLSFVSSPTTGWAQDTAELMDDDGLPRLVVGPTRRTRDRLAVPNTACSATTAVCQQVTSQLRHNFTLSTYFEVLNAKTFVADMKKESFNNTQWPDWFNVGARYLVKGSLSGKGPFALQLRLYDVIDKKTIPVKGQSHPRVKKRGLHRAVNRFINGVIRVVSGADGIFGSRLVYAMRTGERTAAIGVVGMDGFGEYTARGGEAFHMFPHFSPKGILYTSFQSGKPDLWVGTEQLTHDEFHYRGADMSGSGQIAASLSKGDGSDIYVLDKDGVIVRQITDDPAQDISPEWSPGSGQIAFVSDRAGGPQIYVVSAGGGGARRITMAGGYNTNPDWGPNNKIAFTGYTSTGADVFTVDMSGVMVRVTQDQGSNINPTWSRDGRYIAFISSREGGKKIWLASADGRWQFPISNSSRSYTYLKWSR